MFFSSTAFYECKINIIVRNGKTFNYILTAAEELIILVKLLFS
jgi:hypothetical protein